MKFKDLKRYMPVIQDPDKDGQFWPEPSCEMIETKIGDYFEIDDIKEYLKSKNIDIEKE